LAEMATRSPFQPISLVSNLSFMILVPHRFLKNDVKAAGPKISWSVTISQYISENSNTLTLRLLASSFFLIQLRACCWGSIHSGNLLARVVSIPFCIDSSSGGKFSDVHLSWKKTVCSWCKHFHGFHGHIDPRLLNRK
jgi:hypothetical protein